MGDNYEKGMNVRPAHGSHEPPRFCKKNYKRDVRCPNDKIDELMQENDMLCKENQLLKDDNARLKSIINHDSSNTSLLPSTDQKGGKPANTYNGRKFK